MISPFDSVVESVWVNGVVHISHDLFAKVCGLEGPTEHTSAVIVDAPPGEVSGGNGDGLVDKFSR